MKATRLSDQEILDLRLYQTNMELHLNYVKALENSLKRIKSILNKRGTYLADSLLLKIEEEVDKILERI